MRTKLLFLLLASALHVCAQKYSDTIHVAKYTIAFDTINYAGKSLQASCTLAIEVKKNNQQQLKLDLLKLIPDQISSNGQALGFTYKNNKVFVQLPTILNAGNKINLEIKYHGSTYVDPQFGGFYFSGNYAFNIGVGFIADPHNLGKAWFPCVDEFEDRSLYEFYINTARGYRAFCNGILEGSKLLPDGRTQWHWNMKQPIATYLASVAVAPFEEIKRTYKNLPISIAAIAADTANAKKTMAKLDTAINAYIKAWGPYPFDKIGYVLVPFNGGAMEHASSIHIGKAFVDGSLNYETIYPHELAHMWFGDLVTCDKQEEMWLNEGWATYNEAIFTHAAYGAEAYKTWMRNKHRNVIQYAHIKDGNYLALNAVPHNQTYGTTVYDKGADLVHTLRYYMGDTAFFKSVKNYLYTHAFSAVNSSILEQSLTNASGINMSTFFNDWVATPGFPHFYIDKINVQESGGKYQVNFSLAQKGRGNTHLYTMPLKVTFSNGVKDSTAIFILDKKAQDYTINLSYKPDWLYLDRDEHMSDAITDFETNINQSISYSFPTTDMSILSKSSGENANVRAELHWLGPEPKTTAANYQVSKNRYWRVGGSASSKLKMDITFSYNLNANSGLDNDFGLSNSDSLILLYRAEPQNPFSPWPYQQKTKFASGTFTAINAAPGEYVIARNLQANAVNDIKKSTKNLWICPSTINNEKSYDIYFHLAKASGILTISNLEGKVVFKENINNEKSHLRWNTSTIASGMYIINLIEKTEQHSIKAIIE